uniref:Uncharacterized protein n=1 Tax=viral metagenome TaxID=1070528 RepID=A0A6H1ZLF0_9ZZZZ
MDDGIWHRDDLRRAFVVGAAWWEFHTTGATMWRSDRDLAEAEADRRFPGGKPPNHQNAADPPVGRAVKIGDGSSESVTVRAGR